MKTSTSRCLLHPWRRGVELGPPFTEGERWLCAQCRREYLQKDGLTAWEGWDSALHPLIVIVLGGLSLGATVFLLIKAIGWLFGAGGE